MKCENCIHFIPIESIYGYCDSIVPIHVVYKTSFSKHTDATKCQFYEEGTSNVNV